MVSTLGGCWESSATTTSEESDSAAGAVACSPLVISPSEERDSGAKSDVWSSSAAGELGPESMVIPSRACPPRSGRAGHHSALPRPVAAVLPAIPGHSMAVRHDM